MTKAKTLTESEARLLAILMLDDGTLDRIEGPTWTASLLTMKNKRPEYPAVVVNFYDGSWTRATSVGALTEALLHASQMGD